MARFVPCNKEEYAYAAAAAHLRLKPSKRFVDVYLSHLHTHTHTLAQATFADEKTRAKVIKQSKERLAAVFPVRIYEYVCAHTEMYVCMYVCMYRHTYASR